MPRHIILPVQSQDLVFQDQKLATSPLYKELSRGNKMFPVFLILAQIRVQTALDGVRFANHGKDDFTETKIPFFSK
jgi:hypothetical protein